MRLTPLGEPPPTHRLGTRALAAAWAELDFGPPGTLRAMSRVAGQRQSG
jgi:hypothetical protein